MVAVSNAGRVVFPEVGRTKGDVVSYYERVAPRLLPHVAGRPLSLKRFPKGLAAPGFFQKNVPPHYPESIRRFAVPKNPTKRGEPPGETLHPIVSEVEHLAYLANQGVIELHVPTACANALRRPDRLVIDLDPPEGAVEPVRRAARVVGDALAARGVASVPVATGSKGYHVVAPIVPSLDADVVFDTLQKLGALLAAEHPDELTVAYRIARRRGRVFIDWLRNQPNATVVAPYSLRARPRASLAAPLSWPELDSIAPDGFSIADAELLLERPDTLAELAATPADPSALVAEVDADFERSGLALEPFDRFRS